MNLDSGREWQHRRVGGDLPPTATGQQQNSATEGRTHLPNLFEEYPGIEDNDSAATGRGSQLSDVID
jgi:hypothetical protein